MKVEYSPKIQEAWELYCAETAGDMDVRDFWEELPKKAQDLYLEKLNESNS